MKSPAPGGHLDQMMRQTRAHHVQLSVMADQKANMLLTVSALAIPPSAQHLGDERFGVPAAILIAACIATVCLASYAVMPKVMGRGSPPRSPLFNPHFFGDFASMSYGDYVREMERVIAEPGEADESMVRDVYVVGQYLARRKYHYLKYAYLTFMGGMCLGAAVAVAMALVRIAGD